MLKKILIIDDETNILRSLEMILKSEGFTVQKAASLKNAKAIIKKEQFPIYMVDVMLPDGDGINFIIDIREVSPTAIIIMISGHATVQMAVEATRLGADDFLEKPLSKDKLIITLNNFVKRLQLEQKYSDLESAKYGNLLVGESEQIIEIKKQIEKIAPTNSKVLITGESGTGKEIIAYMIHSKSQRKNNAYIKINCAAIPEELIESELFGVEKGAFTGAHQRRDGKFKLADKGTLFLDEIADMSLATQTKVLRVLQEGEFQRVGGRETLTTDVRIIAATNKDLSELINNNTFREDLYFRLHVVPMHVPALRDRRGDIPLLVNHFLNMFCLENNRSLLKMADDVMEKLVADQWSGNIRELKNLIERLVIMTDGQTIEMKHLPADFLKSEFEIAKEFDNKSLQDFRKEAEVQYIRYLMDQNNQNIAQVAQVLQVDRTYLYKKLKSLGLKN
ncbi:sigma-54-dependent transcriptional regulator [Calditrichota bacterium]